MEWKFIALIIAAGAACGGSQRASMDTARIEQNADATQCALGEE